MSARSEPLSTAFREATRGISPSTVEEMDAAIETLRDHMDLWIQVPVEQRIQAVGRLIQDYGAVMAEWVNLSLDAKGAVGDPYAVGLEWTGGPATVLRNLRGLRRALVDIRERGVPAIRGPVSVRPNGQVVANVYPSSLYERLVTPGVTAEVWMEPGVSIGELPETQATAYRADRRSGSVALVLGGGNVSAISVNDSMYKLLVENQVVLLKMNPVNAYLGPLIERAFRALIEDGFLQVVYGGAAEGKYLCEHPGVDEIHVTGSDRTFEAIVFGVGPEGLARKKARQPLLSKRVTAELGNVAPAIVVPGPWRSSDLDYQAEQLVSHLCDNAGYSCSRTRVIVQHAAWALREELLERMRKVMAAVPTCTAYYPGAQELYECFLSAHPDAEQYGIAQEGQIPWTLIAGIDPRSSDDICFATESFCPVIAESAIQASSIPEYLDRAVDFANSRLWGTLSATIIVHPRSLDDPEVAEAVERAIENLNYGTVVINSIPGLAWVMTSPPWGSYPGNEAHDIQSGTGFVHNTHMFSRPQKTVVRAPFKMWPTPIWFNSRARTYAKVARKVALYDLEPSWLKIPGLIAAAV